jgi:hypothetical protein
MPRRKFRSKNVLKEGVVKMAHHALAKNFTYFFKRLNPSPTFERIAAGEHRSITTLIEDPNGLASGLSPKCFLQGSYKQDTAIYTINDVDIVTLCELWYPGSGSAESRSWSRDEIFDTIAQPLLNDGRYKDKVHYHSESMCIKVDLSIKIEILPVVYKTGNNDPQKEPFCLYRPQKKRWEDGYARYHQAQLSLKNRGNKTSGNFIPVIKVLKHLRSRFSLDVVSFHIECFLFSLPDSLFKGSPADYIPTILSHIASTSASAWYNKEIKTPCGEREIFVESEWKWPSWEEFHKAAVIWADCAKGASEALDRDAAIKFWQLLLGEDFFPKQVS